MPTRSFGHGVAGAMIPSQMILEFKRMETTDEGNIEDVILRAHREPFVPHYRETIITPFTTEGALCINVKADFLANFLGSAPDKTNHGTITFFKFEWSMDRGDELMLKGKLDHPYPSQSNKKISRTHTQTF